MNEKTRKILQIILKIFSWLAFIWGLFGLIVGLFLTFSNDGLNTFKRWKFYLFAVLPFLFIIVIFKDIKRIIKKFYSAIKTLFFSIKRGFQRLLNLSIDEFLKLSIIVVIILIGLSIAYYFFLFLPNKEKMRIEAENAKAEQQKQEQLLADQQKKEQEQKDYIAKRKSDCLAIYKAESDKWNNVLEWHYIEPSNSNYKSILNLLHNDTCEILYKDLKTGESFSKYY
jgi:ABC-type multidrug transport system fused ATPase/permease subunit